MDLIRWQKKYSIGNEVIDQQHQQLFRFSGKFIESFGTENRDAQETVLEEMVQYVEYHFSTEEAYFKDHPNLADHQQQHNDFSHKIQGLLNDFAKQKEELSLDILKFILTWLKNHILNIDIQYFKDMKEMNLG